MDRRPARPRSLSFRLLLLTAFFVMVAEVLIFAPSVARYRLTWMEGRLADGHLAALAVEAAPENMLTDALIGELLAHTGAITIDVTKPGERMLMLSGPDMPEPDAVVDLGAQNAVMLIADAFATLVRTQDRILKLVGDSPRDAGIRVEMLVREAPLRAEMLDFAVRIFWLSIVIALITAVLVYVALAWILVAPMRRIAASIMAFGRDPEDPDAIVAPTDRTDEIGQAQRELARMQLTLRTALRQQQRLAALGTAVAKIHHDLGGILSTAALLSERLAASGDPEARRVAPRLLDSIDRAVDLSAQTLAYSREGVLPMRAERVPIAEIAASAGEEIAAWASRDPDRRTADWAAEIPDGLAVVADREQMTRVLWNLGRNAVQAGATRVVVSAAREADGRVRIDVADDGPGLPPRAREHLFQPFAGTSRADGHGLGLAIAREVVRGHGGDIALLRSDAQGTVFRLTLPAGSGARR
jgi:signal transduction histidine kinase